MTDVTTGMGDRRVDLAGMRHHPRIKQAYNQPWPGNVKCGVCRNPWPCPDAPPADQSQFSPRDPATTEPKEPE